MSAPRLTARDYSRACTLPQIPNKLRHCDPILIHTAKVGGAIQMWVESRCACRTTHIVACTVAVHPVTGFCLGCTAAVQINPTIF
jgi:hypothetical protein